MGQDIDMIAQFGMVFKDVFSSQGLTAKDRSMISAG